MKIQATIPFIALFLALFSAPEIHAQTTTSCYYYESTANGTTEKCTITLVYDSVKVKASCKKESVSGSTKKNDNSTKNGSVSGDTLTFQGSAVSPRMREMMTAKGLTPPSGNTEIWTFTNNKNQLIMDGKTYNKITCP